MLKRVYNAGKAWYSTFMSNIKAISNSDIIFIKLNTENGKTPKDISRLSGLPISVVKSVIADYKFAPTGKSTEGLLDLETRKQTETAPLYLQLELMMLAKAKDFLEDLQISDADFGGKFNIMARSLKDMRATAPLQLSQQQANLQNTGIQVQVISKFDDKNDKDNNTIQLRAESVSNSAI